MTCASRRSLLGRLTVVVMAVGCGNTSLTAEEGAHSEPGDAAHSKNLPLQKNVTWDKDGVIDGRFGIQGWWTAYNDEPSATEAGLEPTRPDDGLVGPDKQPGWSTSAKRICSKGTVPKIATLPNGEPAFGQQWGAGLGLDLNQGEPYDAQARGILGFMFDITEGTAGAASPPTLKVSIDIPSVDVGDSYLTHISLPATDQAVLFSELEQPWAEEPKPFTPSALIALTFQVIPNTQAPKSYDFCVSNLRVLM
jgi:hypothetical protein